MNAAAQRRLTAPLAAAVLLLGLLFLLFLAGIGRGVHWAAPRKPAPLPAQHAATLPPPVPLERYAPVWQQPLFNPDRKPVAHAASGGGGQLGDMQLTGIILTPTLRMALLHNKRQGGTGQELRVREGTRLPDGSWTLVEVKPRSAVFDSSSGRVELQLPAGAPIDQVRGPGPGPGGVPAEDSSVPDELPEGTINRTHRLRPPDENDQQDDNPQDQPGPGPGPGMPESSDGADEQDNPPPNGGAALSALRGGPARMDMSNDERQAERLRQLRAAIEKRRAEQAAAKANEGDR
jgi:general secretion pathway protein N